jgi:hypothetical protein
LLQILWNRFLILETVSQRLDVTDPQIYVAMTSNVSIEAMLSDVTAAFKAIGRSEDVGPLGTETMDCVIEFLGSSLLSEFVAKPEEAFAVYEMQ